MPRVEPERLHIEPTATINRWGPFNRVTTFLYGDVDEARMAREIGITEYRVDQLSPQPKIEFERDEEDMDYE